MHKRRGKNSRIVYGSDNLGQADVSRSVAPIWFCQGDRRRLRRPFDDRLDASASACALAQSRRLRGPEDVWNNLHA